MHQFLTGKIRLLEFEGEWTERNMTKDSELKARIGWQGLTTAEYLESGNYRLVTGTDFKDGQIDWRSCCYVKRERYEQDRNIQLQIGDVLLTKDGTIGKVAYVDRLPVPATLNSGVFVVRPINNSFNSLYFYYVLRSRIFTEFLKKLQAGSTINHLYQKDFLNFSFTAPQLPEQEAIANVLSDIDAEISALEAQIKKMQYLKQAAMQQLLTSKTRLPGFEEKWSSAYLPDVLVIRKGDLMTSSRLRQGNIPVIAGGINPAYFHDTPNRIGPCVTISASGANAGFVAFYKNPIFASDCSTIESSDYISAKFAFYKLKLHQAELFSLQSGGAQPHVQPNDLARLIISYPNRNEQDAIVSILSDMDAEITALEQRRNKSKDMKQAMMQELLTGKTRLVKSEEIHA